MILSLVCAFSAIFSINANPLFENWKLAAQHRTGGEMVEFLKAEIEKSDDIEVIREARRLITEVYDPISKMEIKKSNDNVACVLASCYVAFCGYMLYKICTTKPSCDSRDLLIIELCNKLAQCQSIQASPL